MNNQSNKKPMSATTQTLVWVMFALITISVFGTAIQVWLKK